MEQQLNGPQRDEALAAIRDVARLAEELAAVLRARDYARLRDMMRNRHAGDLAALLTELSLEDQVVVFRVLPRKDAAAVFEYLSHDAKEVAAQSDGAGGRRGHCSTTWRPTIERCSSKSCPPTVTRQLLALLTPEERAVALTLLGYPETLRRPADDAELRGGPRALDGRARCSTTSVHTARTARR